MNQEQSNSLHWHILHVRAHEEEEIAQVINQNQSLEAFVPKLVRIIKRNGIRTHERKRIFPNYVFIKSSLNTQEFFNYIQNELRPLVEYFRVLKYKDIELETLSESEKLYLSQFLDQDYELKASEGFIVGKNVVITQGPLMGLESTIVYIDRHKRIADISLKMFGEDKIIRVGLEILHKQP